MVEADAMNVKPKQSNLTRIDVHFPKWQEVLYVFGVVVFLVYSWAVRGFFYQLSSLRLYHTIGEILAVFSYVMAFALLESILVISGLVFLGIVLPQKWLRDGFAYKGFVVALVMGVAMIGLHYYMFSLRYAMPPLGILFSGFGAAIILLVVLILISQNNARLQSFLLSMAERVQIFLYLYIPLGLVGLAVVFLRNLS